MRFIDANVFIYAILKPKKTLPDSVMMKKKAAREIFLRVNSGEPVITTPVHLSEVANVLEDIAGLEFTCDLLSSIMIKSSILIEPVSGDDYRESAEHARKYKISVNDALALVIMERKAIQEIYSFDRHFDSTPLRVVQE